MAEEFDVEFIRWSVDARKGIQSAILNLAVCYKKSPNPMIAGDRAEKFCELSGILFSLWRAAFLASMDTRPRLSHSVREGELVPGALATR